MNTLNQDTEPLQLPLLLPLLNQPSRSPNSTPQAFNPFPFKHLVQQKIISPALPAKNACQAPKQAKRLKTKQHPLGV
jgi:hypothetical protein